MWASLLNPLFASVTALAGIAHKTDKASRKVTGHHTDARVLDPYFICLLALSTGAISRSKACVSSSLSSRQRLALRTGRRSNLGKSVEVQNLIVHSALIAHYETASIQPNNRVLDRQTKAA